jgi:hypothetical protein
LVPDTILAPKSLKELNAYTNALIDRAYTRDLSKKAAEELTLLDDLVEKGKSHKVQRPAPCHEPDAYEKGRKSKSN